MAKRLNVLNLFSEGKNHKTLFNQKLLELPWGAIKDLGKEFALKYVAEWPMANIMQ